MRDGLAFLGFRTKKKWVHKYSSRPNDPKLGFLHQQFKPEVPKMFGSIDQLGQLCCIAYFFFLADIGLPSKLKTTLGDNGLTQSLIVINPMRQKSMDLRFTRTKILWPLYSLAAS